MTKMTVGGVSTTKGLGQEQYEIFNCKSSRFQKTTTSCVQYDYRHTDGELFSCVKKTLESCRAAREEWLNRKSNM